MKKKLITALFTVLLFASVCAVAPSLPMKDATNRLTAQNTRSDKPITDNDNIPPLHG